MWRIGLRQAGRFALGLLGAVFLAAAIAALSAPGAAFLPEFPQRLLSVVRLDFGASILTGQAAAAGLGPRFSATFELLGIGALIALVLGVPLGIGFGMRRSLRAAALLIQIVAAAPVFCASLGLIWIAVNLLGWRDMSYAGHDPLAALFAADRADLGQAWRAFSIPVLTVGLAGAACVQLVIRRAVVQAQAEPFRRGLRLMGLSAFDVDRFFVAPQVIAHLLASMGEIYLALLAAAAVAEWVFGWPGAVALFLRSVALHDWGVAAAILLAFSAIKVALDVLGTLGARVLTDPEFAR